MSQGLVQSCLSEGKPAKLEHFFSLSVTVLTLDPASSLI